MELIFPQNIQCINCNQPISKKNKYSLCKNCYYKIDFLKNQKTDFDKIVLQLKEKNYIKDINIVTKYTQIMKNLIHNIKYNNKTYISKYFADMILDYIKYKNIDFDYISCVPIHKKRLNQRGYNQVDLIAKIISQSTNIPLIYPSTRIKNTHSMYELSLKDRKEQMKEAFTSNTISYLDNKTLLIIDDILTTGSTIENLCKSIHKKNKTTNIKLIFLSRAPEK